MKHFFAQNDKDEIGERAIYVLKSYLKLHPENRVIVASHPSMNNVLDLMKGSISGIFFPIFSFTFLFVYFLFFFTLQIINGYLFLILSG
jgi:hypothetical protein